MAQVDNNKSGMRFEEQGENKSSESTLVVGDIIVDTEEDYLYEIVKIEGDMFSLVTEDGNNIPNTPACIIRKFYHKIGFHDLKKIKQQQQPSQLSLKDFNKRSREPGDQLERLDKIMESFDANAIADHKAKIDEREYWRKLRGEIFSLLMQDYPGRSLDHSALENTEKYLEELYKQDQEFFKDK